MKKLFSIALTTIIAFVTFTSCNKEDNSAKEFLATLSQTLSSGKADSIAMLYPGAEKFETFNSRLLVGDSVKIEIQEDGTYKVAMSDRASLVMQRDETGKYMVKESKGLFNFDSKRVEFAKKTGWIESTMNDVKVAEQFADTLFVEWLGREFVANVKKNLSVKLTGTYGDDKYMGEWVSAEGIVVTVTNNNDFLIPGACYKVHCKDWYWGDPSMSSSRTNNGQDVAAHGKVTMRVALSTNMESENSQKLEFVDSEIFKLLAEHYVPKGTEYKDYLNSKK